MGPSRRGTEAVRKKFFLFREKRKNICRASRVTQGEVIWEGQALKRAGWDQIREMYVWLCIKMCKQLDYFCMCAPEAWKSWGSVWLCWELVGILPFCPFLSLGLVNIKGGEWKAKSCSWFALRSDLNIPEIIATFYYCHLLFLLTPRAEEAL